MLPLLSDVGNERNDHWRKKLSNPLMRVLICQQCPLRIYILHESQKENILLFKCTSKLHIQYIHASLYDS